MASKKVIYSVMTMSLTLVILGCTPMQNTKAEDTTQNIEVVGTIDLDNPKIIAKDGKLVKDEDVQQTTTSKAEQSTKKNVTVKYKVKKTKYYRYAKKIIVVKSKPIKKGKIKFKIKKGTKIKVIGKVSNGWRKVKVKGKTGYIPNKNLSKKKIKTSTKKTTQKKTNPSNGFNGDFRVESEKDYDKREKELIDELKKNGVMNEDGTMNPPKGNFS